MSTPETDPRPVADLSYEEARDELVRLVARIEGGDTPLEESMRLWQRGEDLAAHCTAWLDRAQAGLDGRPDPESPREHADESDDPATPDATGFGDGDVLEEGDPGEDVEPEDDEDEDEDDGEDEPGPPAPRRER